MALAVFKLSDCQIWKVLVLIYGKLTEIYVISELNRFIFSGFAAIQRNRFFLDEWENNKPGDDKERNVMNLRKGLNIWQKGNLIHFDLLSRYKTIENLHETLEEFFTWGKKIVK